VVALTKIRDRIPVTIAFIEARVRLHWSGARSGILEIVGASNLLGVMSLGQICSTLVHVVHYHTGSVVEPPHRCLHKRPDGVHGKCQVLLIGAVQ